MAEPEGCYAVWVELALVESSSENRTDLEEGKPPLFASWVRLYAAIIAYLAALILLFYLFTRAFHLPQ